MPDVSEEVSGHRALRFISLRTAPSTLSKLTLPCAIVLTAQSVRRELAHYMKAELGMKVAIPEKVKKPKPSAKRTENGGGGSSKTAAANMRPAKSAKAASSTAKTAATTPSPTTSASPASPSTAQPKSHKARQRERQKKQRAQKAAATTPAPDTPPPPPEPTPSTNKNTLKNKRRRAKEKEHRQHKAELKLTAPALFPPAATASIDPSVKNSTKPSSLFHPSTPAPPPLSYREQRIAEQAVSEATSARFSAIAASFEQGRWYTHPHAQYSAPSSPHTVVLTPDAQQRLASHKAKAQALLASYGKSVSQVGGGMDREDQRWLSQIMTGGTLSDKIAGMALLLQDRCVGRLDLLERLLAMAQKKGRRESTMALDALKDVFINELLPADRPLVFFSHREALQGGGEVDDTTLMYWLFEDALKHAYTQFLTVLETHLHDTMTYIKKAAINALFSLLSSLPEREKVVLTLLVNKLGDPDKKVASRIVYLLSELVHLHRGMRMAVVKEVEAFLLRKGVSERGQYYAVIFLNQLRLHAGDDAPLAQRMIAVYFAVFAMEVRRVEAVNSKLLGGILTGINRAMPYAKAGGEVALKDAQVDLLFSLTHTAAFHTAVQALMLLWQVVAEDPMSQLAARYYRALYDLMRGDAAGVGGKVSLFLNLLYRSMKGDESEARVAAFVKRLLQVALGKSVGFLCGCLYLISEVSQKHGGVKRMMSQGDWKGEDEEEHFTDVKEDDDEDSPASASHSSSKRAEEEMEDVKEEKDSRPANGSKLNGGGSSSAPSHAYDPHKREPLYANAHLSGLWELTVLLQHYHPSVQAWTRLLLTSVPIVYNGDPLVDFTLTSFLDRFVFRNPRTTQSKKPALVAHSHLQKGGGRLVKTPELQVSSRAFLQKRPGDVREDEAFYYQYFKEKERREVEGIGRQKKKAKATGEERGDDEEAIDEFADRIMEAELLKAQQPDLDDEDDLLKALAEDNGADEGQGDGDEDGEGEEGEEGEELTAEMMAMMDGLDEGVDEDDEAEAEAEAELTLDEEDDDLDMPTFSDEEDDDEDDEDEEDEEEKGGSGRQRKKRRVDGRPAAAVGLGSDSVFASAEEFADLLNEGMEGQAMNRKEKQREFTHDRAGGGRGGRGGRGRGGRGRRGGRGGGPRGGKRR